MSHNMRNLTKVSLAGHVESFPTMITAVQKLKMYIHARYLRKVLLWFAECNFENLANNESAEHLKALYNEVSEEYFEQKLWNTNLSFNEFWNNLLQKKQIDEDNLHNYNYVKMQTCILWQAMNVLFHSGEAENTDYYIIRPENTEELAATPMCKNSLLEKVLSLMTRNEYTPANISWNNQQEIIGLKPPFNLKAFIEGTDFCNDSCGVSEKTLEYGRGDFTILQGMSVESLEKIVMLYIVENDLAQALADLMNVYLSTLEVLGGEVDFLGNAWEEDAATQAEIEQLRKFNYYLQEQLPNIISSIQVKHEESTNPWAGYEGDLWEEVALTNKLMTRIPDEAGHYRIAVNGAKIFQEMLKEGIKERLQSNENLINYMPTDKILTEKIRKKDGTKYGRNTFHGSRFLF